MQNQPSEGKAGPRIPPPLGLVRQPAREDPRLDPKVLSAVARIAPGTELRQAIDDIIRSKEGALIVIGEPNDIAFLLSGGMRLDQGFTPQFLYELAKMDGAIIVNSPVTKIAYANVQLMPDPTIATLETYRTRLEQVLTRLTALEFQNAVMLDDVLVTLQRAELATRMDEEIERACVE